MTQIRESQNVGADGPSETRLNNTFHSDPERLSDLSKVAHRTCADHASPVSLFTCSTVQKM